MSNTSPRILETECAWTSEDVSDPSRWIVHLSSEDLLEIDKALKVSSQHGGDLLAITREEFPLGELINKLAAIEHELMFGKGFALIRGVPRAQYTAEEMSIIYWGIGMHLGSPWPQNKHGHLLGDVTDQGRAIDDPTGRGNELGGIALEFHTDGADLVGLMCLENGIEGGESALCSSVAVYNEFVKQRPDLAAELFKPQPYDFRGEEAPGMKPWYQRPVFIDFNDRIFIRYVGEYIRTSQRHADAPRLTDKAIQAMTYFEALINQPEYHIYMPLIPGDMQFINNYHVLHGRKAYTDDPGSGRVRHLKRLWLETRVFDGRPKVLRNASAKHWGKSKTISRLDVPSSMH